MAESKNLTLRMSNRKVEVFLDANGVWKVNDFEDLCSDDDNIQNLPLEIPKQASSGSPVAPQQESSAPPDSPLRESSVPSYVPTQESSVPPVIPPLESTPPKDSSTEIASTASSDNEPEIVFIETTATNSSQDFANASTVKAPLVEPTAGRLSPAAGNPKGKEPAPGDGEHPKLTRGQKRQLNISRERGEVADQTAVTDSRPKKGKLTPNKVHFRSNTPPFVFSFTPSDAPNTTEVNGPGNDGKNGPDATEKISGPPSLLSLHCPEPSSNSMCSRMFCVNMPSIFGQKGPITTAGRKDAPSLAEIRESSLFGHNGPIAISGRKGASSLAEIRESSLFGKNSIYSGMHAPIFSQISKPLFGQNGSNSIDSGLHAPNNTDKITTSIFGQHVKAPDLTETNRPSNIVHNGPIGMESRIKAPNITEAQPSHTEKNRPPSLLSLDCPLSVKNQNFAASVIRAVVIRTEYPEVKMCEEDGEIVSQLVEEEIDRMKLPPPRFEGTKWTGHLREYLCADEETFKFLKAAVGRKYRVCCFDELMPRTKLQVYFPKEADEKIIFRRLEYQNPGISCRHWITLDVRPEVKGFTMVIAVDDETKDRLEKCFFNLYYVVSKVQFKKLEEVPKVFCHK